MREAWHELLLRAHQENDAENYAQAHQLAREACELLVAESGRGAAKRVSLLLSNAVYASTPYTVTKCPRCEVEVLRWEEGAAYPVGCAISRTSRGVDDAEIPICARCGEREAHSAALANPDDPERWRSGEGIAPPVDWPVPVDHLLAEDRAIYELGREASIDLVDLDELGET
jgi:ribosomal protein L40E